MEVVWKWLETQTSADIVSLIRNEYTTIAYYTNGPHVRLYNTVSNVGVSFWNEPRDDVDFEVFDYNQRTRHIYFKNPTTWIGDGSEVSVPPVASGFDGFYIHQALWHDYTLVKVPHQGAVAVYKDFHRALRTFLS